MLGMRSGVGNRFSEAAGAPANCGSRAFASEAGPETGFSTSEKTLETGRAYGDSGAAVPASRSARLPDSIAKPMPIMMNPSQYRQCCDADDTGA